MDTRHRRRREITYRPERERRSCFIGRHGCSIMTITICIGICAVFAHYLLKELKSNLVNMQQSLNMIVPAALANSMQQFISAKEEHVDKRIQQALDKYDMDKTGLTDYALQSAGGSIVSIGNTKTLQSGTSVKVFGIKICRFSRNIPEAILQPSVLLKECWAFEGERGIVIIQLFTTILLTAISIEHISKEIAPQTELEAAPHNFSVYIVVESNDSNNNTHKNHLLGRYYYDINSTAIQHFELPHTGKPVDQIAIKFHTNHGNPIYTCVYRIRVHGVPVDSKYVV